MEAVFDENGLLAIGFNPDEEDVIELLREVADHLQTQGIEVKDLKDFFDLISAGEEAVMIFGREDIDFAFIFLAEYCSRENKKGKDGLDVSEYWDMLEVAREWYYGNYPPLLLSLH